MKPLKIREKAFSFAALLFEKATECMNFMSDLFKGDKVIEIKFKNKEKKEV